MKVCTKCGKEKPATAEYFYRRSASRDGLQSQCKPCRNAQHQKRLEDNPEYMRKYYESNKEAWKEYRRKYRQENPEKAREYAREHQRKLRQDVGVRVSQSISTGMRISLLHGKNGRKWESLVGYALADLTSCLESQFTKGMTWDNYGAWHIDHRKPISHFNFTSTDDPEFLECWSLWNLQPLWAFDNISKNDKCDAPPLPLLHRGGAATQ